MKYIRNKSYETITLPVEQIRMLASGVLSEIWLPMCPQPSTDAVYIDRYDWDYGHFCAWDGIRQQIGENGSVEDSPYWGSPVGPILSVLAVLESYYADTREKVTSWNPAIIYAATPEWCREKRNFRPTRCKHVNGDPVSREDSRANLVNHEFMKLHDAEDMPDWAVRFYLVVTGVEARKVGSMTTRELTTAGIPLLTDENPPDIDSDQIPAYFLRNYWKKHYHDLAWDGGDVWAWRVGVSVLHDDWRGHYPEAR